MFTLEDPATWPREGDQLWLPWHSLIAFTVAGCYLEDGHPRVKFVDGEVDWLLGWQHYPRVGDEVIIAARPLKQFYPEHKNQGKRDRLTRETLRIVSESRRPLWGVASGYGGRFFRLESIKGSGESFALPDLCCVVIRRQLQ